MHITSAIYDRMWYVVFMQYGNVMMGAIASQIISITIVYSTVLGADHKKHRSSASLAFLREFTGNQWNPHKGPAMRKMLPFDDGDR